MEVFISHTGQNVAPKKNVVPEMNAVPDTYDAFNQDKATKMKTGPEKNAAPERTVEAKNIMVPEQNNNLLIRMQQLTGIWHPRSPVQSIEEQEAGQSGAHEGAMMTAQRGGGAGLSCTCPGHVPDASRTSSYCPVLGPMPRFHGDTGQAPKC